jgi:hypothetical protein
MKAIPRLVGTAAALALLLVLVQATRGDEPKAPPSPEAFLQAVAEAGKPGPEHKKLEPFVGDWTVTIKLWTNPNQPPAEAKGTVERKWILGGRFVQESASIQCNGKSFEGLGLLGYDRGQKKFTVVRACGLCGTISHSLATATDSGRRFECATEECCPLSGQKIKGRDEILIESNDRIVVNVFKTVNGNEAKVMEIVSVRNK